MVNCCKLWFPNNLSIPTFIKQVVSHDGSMWLEIFTYMISVKNGHMNKRKWLDPSWVYDFIIWFYGIFASIKYPGPHKTVFLSGFPHDFRGTHVGALQVTFSGPGLNSFIESQKQAGQTTHGCYGSSGPIKSLGSESRWCGFVFRKT